MIKVWIDTDIGDDIDDAVALLCAARHPEMQLAGISTVYGWVETRAWLAQELLARAGDDAPVLQGCVRPLTGKDASHGKRYYNVLAPELPPLSPQEDDARIGAIARAMEAVPEPFQLVTIGAMTNAANVALRHPAVTARWQGVTCVAGRLDGEIEWNIHCDPAAARITIEKLRPRFIGLEACSDTLPKHEVEELLDTADPASAFLLDCYRAYRLERDEPDDGLPLTLFDPICLLSLIAPEAFNLQRIRVMMDAEGRMRLDEDGLELMYGLSSDWSRIKPLIRKLLQGR